MIKKAKKKYTQGFKTWKWASFISLIIARPS